jgi:hypothetical protein
MAKFLVHISENIEQMTADEISHLMKVQKESASPNFAQKCVRHFEQLVSHMCNVLKADKEKELFGSIRLDRDEMKPMDLELPAKVVNSGCQKRS